MVLGILRPSALTMVQPKYSDAGRNVDLNRPIIIWVVRLTEGSRSDEYALIFLFVRFCLTGESLEAHIWRAPELGQAKSQKNSCSPRLHCAE